MNAVYLIGKLVADPQKTELGSRLLAEFTLEVVAGYKRTMLFDCQAWYGQASTLEAKQGATVVVEGSLTQELWGDKATGEARSKVVVEASYIRELAKRKATSDETAVATT